MFALIALKMMALIIIFTLLQVIMMPVSLSWLLPIDLILFGLDYWDAYECGVYQQLSTYAGINAFQLLIVIIVECLAIWGLNVHFSDEGTRVKIAGSIGLPMILAIFMFIGALGIHSFISIHTNYAMRSSARSISVKEMGDDKIPTLNKHDTPEPLSPKTVFQEIDNNWSQVPHPNAYGIATNENGNREIQAQYYHGKPVYIVPLEFEGGSGRSAHGNYHYYRTIPGYWMISATNPNDSPHFVHKTIRYSDSSYFNHNTDRLLYKSHPEAVEISENAQLEINNHGDPYYVETLRKANNSNNRPNFHDLETSSVNAQNGKVHFYHHLNQAPRFIDESVTSDVAHDITEDYGENRGGYWNINGFLLWGGHQNGVMKPTNVGPEDDMTTVFHKGHIDYETDMTTPGSGHSALGVLTVDGRTGHIKLYKSKGMNDGESAEDQADRNYDNHNDWDAHMPVPYDIKGRPTWVSVITDSQGRIKRFYYQDAHDSNISADGDTPNSALDNYKAELLSGIGSNHSSSASKNSKEKGTVDRVVASPSKVLFTLKGQSKWYEATSPNAVLMKTGDKVTFKTGYHGIGHSAKHLIDSEIR